jgi:hypothetical protein
MPTYADIGPYKLFFYSAEGNEPPHVHILRDRATAKFWLDPVRIAASRRFSDSDLRSLQKLVEENEDAIMEAWNDYFGD